MSSRASTSAGDAMALSTIDTAHAGLGQQAAGALPFPDGATFRGVLPVLIVCLCALVIEASLAVVVLAGRLEVMRALAAHLGLVALLGAWLVSRLHRDE